MKYKVQITDKILKNLEKLPAKDRIRIINSIDSLVICAHPEGSKKLKGKIERYRLRCGDYRVVYSVQDHVLLIIILEIGHRKDIYR